MCNATTPTTETAETKVCPTCDGWTGHPNSCYRRHGQLRCCCDVRLPEHVSYRCPRCMNWTEEHRRLCWLHGGTLCVCKPEPPPAKAKGPKLGGVNHGTPISCPCGWAGLSHVRSTRANYKIVDCPSCGRIVQPLTAEQAAVVERSSGRTLGQHVALVYRLIGRHYGDVPPDAHDELFDAGMEALLKAAIRFDPASGRAFSTFATSYISGAMKNRIRDRQLDAARFEEYATLLHAHRPERVEHVVHAR